VVGPGCCVEEAEEEEEEEEVEGALLPLPRNEKSMAAGGQKRGQGCYPRPRGVNQVGGGPWVRAWRRVWMWGGGPCPCATRHSLAAALAAAAEGTWLLLLPYC
jgi:hypothetical protein